VYLAKTNLHVPSCIETPELLEDHLIKSTDLNHIIIGEFSDEMKCIHPITMPKYETTLNCFLFEPLLKSKYPAALTIFDVIHRTCLLKVHGISLGSSILPTKLYEITVFMSDLVKYQKALSKFDDLHRVNVICNNEGVYNMYFKDYNHIRLEHMHIHFHTIINNNYSEIIHEITHEVKGLM
jgi:hypothetical protein